jgi:hypothetical protein
MVRGFRNRHGHPAVMNQRVPTQPTTQPLCARKLPSAPLHIDTRSWLKHQLSVQHSAHTDLTSGRTRTHNATNSVIEQAALIVRAAYSDPAGTVGITQLAPLAQLGRQAPWLRRG